MLRGPLTLESPARQASSLMEGRFPEPSRMSALSASLTMNWRAPARIHRSGSQMTQANTDSASFSPMALASEAITANLGANLAAASESTTTIPLPTGCLRSRNWSPCSPKEDSMKKQWSYALINAAVFAFGLVGVAEVWAQNGVIGLQSTCIDAAPRRVYVMRGEAESDTNPRVLLPLPGLLTASVRTAAFGHDDQWSIDCSATWPLRHRGER